MAGILDDALGCLETCCPADFAKWTALGEYGPPGLGIRRAIGVVDLARLVDDVGLLLMALLVCCEFEDVALSANMAPVKNSPWARERENAYRSPGITRAHASASATRAFDPARPRVRLRAR